MNNTLKNRLQYHVTGAIERGEAQAIVEIPALHRGPFPLHITKNEDHSVIITSQGNHYAKTFDPSAAKLISAAPDLLDALQACLDYLLLDSMMEEDAAPEIEKIKKAISKAKGEA